MSHRIRDDAFSPEETVRVIRAAERQKAKAVALQILREGRNMFVPLELS